MTDGRRLEVIQLVALVAALSGACSQAEDAAPPPRADAVQSLASSGTNRGLSLAASDQTVAAVWATTVDEVTNVFAATSTDGGSTFGAPVRVNDVDGDARVNGEQPPRVAITGGDVVVVWSSRTDGASRVRLARSNDGGRTFSAARDVHPAGLTGARGWASLAMGTDGAAHITWLDGRNAVRPPSAAPTSSGGSAAAGHVHGGSTRQDIVQAVFRRDATLDEHEVAANVCFCCKTGTTMAPDGTTYVAWRHIYPVNLRDMAVARSTDGGRTFSAPTRVSEDGWQLESCPEDGPAIAAGASGEVHIAWPTLAPGTTDRKAVFYSVSTDQGRSFAPRVRVDASTSAGIAAHPQIAASGAHVGLVWEETGDKGRVVKFTTVGHVSSGGWAPQPEHTVTMPADDSAVYPAVAATSDGFIVGWTLNTANGSRIQVVRVR